MGKVAFLVCRGVFECCTGFGMGTSMVLFVGFVGGYGVVGGFLH